MRSKEGQDIWSTGIYKEIIPYSKIVCSDSFADSNGNVVPSSFYGMTDDIPLEMEVSIIFEDQDSKTKMTLTHTGLPKGELQEMTRVGWNESFDKLSLLLKKISK